MDEPYLFNKIKHQLELEWPSLGWVAGIQFRWWPSFVSSLH